MSFAAILVEILIVGVISSIWLLLLALSIFGYVWIPNLIDSIKGLPVIIPIVYISVLYVIGIFFDRVADCFSS